MTAEAGDYLAKVERSLSGGVLHLMLLAQIAREGPIHGYALIKNMSEALGTRDGFKEGTVYPLLSELETLGYIRSRWGQGTTGPRRKYYELTSPGRALLQQGAQEWQRVRNGVDSILNEKGVKRT